MSHSLLADVDQQLSRAIDEPAGFAFVLLYGPSGVGKTTLIRQLEHRAGVVKEPAMPGFPGGLRHASPFAPVPLLLLETRPPDGSTFNRAEYYQVALKQLGEYPYEHSWEQKKGRGKEAKFNDSSELRQVYEAALQRRGVRTIILDEAQHLLKLSSGVKLIDQLDWLKSMTNTTGVLHILTGTYELLPLRNLNGQAARRGLEIHFPRYQFQHEPDQLAFQRVLLTLLQQMPLEVDVKAFVDQWPYFYERCIGCIGVLKDWLVRALAATIGASQTKLLFERIQECALPIAQCESMALEAAAGERELHYTASRRQHLWALLGMNTGGEVVQEQMTPTQEVPEAKQGSRVGEPQPVRLEVGEQIRKGRTENCSFSGAAVALQPVQLTAAGVEKLQCPECGAARKATVRGETITFPSHTPLRIPRTQKGSLWIRQGTIWAIR
ncbi:MAG: ATP-binding protein [Ktedonobacteraceae bacterium]